MNQVWSFLGAVALHLVVVGLIFGVGEFPSGRPIQDHGPREVTWVTLETGLVRSGSKTFSKEARPSSGSSGETSDLGKFYRLSGEGRPAPGVELNGQRASGSGMVYSGAEGGKALQEGSAQIRGSQQIANLSEGSRAIEFARKLNRAVQYPPEFVSARIEGQLRVEFDFDFKGRAVRISKIRATNPYLSAYVSRKILNTLQESDFESAPKRRYALHANFVLRKIQPTDLEQRLLHTSDEFQVTREKLAIVRYAVVPLVEIGPLKIVPGGAALDLLEIFNKVRSLQKKPPDPLEVYRRDSYYVTELG